MPRTTETTCHICGEPREQQGKIFCSATHGQLQTTKMQPDPQTTPIRSEAEILTFEQKTARNCRMQKRYDKLIKEGKHGHYETMFRVWHEEFELAKRMSQ